jgi:hypothetical protein
MADHKPTGEELQMADIRTIIELKINWYMRVALERS